MRGSFFTALASRMQRLLLAFLCSLLRILQILHHVFRILLGFLQVVVFQALVGVLHGVIQLLAFLALVIHVVDGAVALALAGVLGGGVETFTGGTHDAVDDVMQVRMHVFEFGGTGRHARMLQGSADLLIGIGRAGATGTHAGTGSWSTGSDGGGQDHEGRTADEQGSESTHERSPDFVLVSEMRY